MDDRDVEARLSARLHHRFDSAAPPRELVASVEQLIATPPRRFGRAAVRGGSLRLGWPALVAAAAVLVAVVGGVSIGRFPGLGADLPTAEPSATEPPQRWFVVLAPDPAVPAKDSSSLASDIMAARLRALGYGNFTGGVGYAIRFAVPADGPSDEATRRVLGATGDVEFVPLPPEDYGEGKAVAEVGKALPKQEPALFGWDGIESVAFGTDQQDRQTLEFVLKPLARTAFGDYTAGHVMGSIAIVVDGVVVSVPSINEPIPGGQISISNGTVDGSFDAWAAILVGGMLPEAWRGAEVPPVVAREVAIAEAQRGMPYSTLESADVDAIYEGDRWHAVWSVVLLGDFPYACPNVQVGQTPCPTASSALILLDASTGVVLNREFPAP